MMIINNVRLVDFNKDYNGFVIIKDKKIHSFHEGMFDPQNLTLDTYKNARLIDGKGYTLMPSFIDLHVHFRDPGLTHKEDIETGSKAAVRGGYTFANLMANTIPVCSDMDTINYVHNKAKEVGLIEVNQMASITNNFDGKTLSHLDKLDKSVKWVSDDGTGVMNSAIMLDAMKKAKELNIGMMCHEEDLPLVKLDSYLAEDIMTIRDTRMATLLGTRLHVCHVSTKKSMDAIIEAKKQGANVTCEVAPHHILLNDETKYNVNPPLRNEENRQAVFNAVINGYVDAIATDHAPHTQEDKQKGANGISGIEHAFPIVNTCYKNILSLSQISNLMSKNPADIMGINKGRIQADYDADFALVDPDANIIVRASEMVSKGKNTPLEGKELIGDVLMTIHKGEIVYDKLNG